MKALVIGAGIAGLTAANALRHFGWDAVVFERAGDLSRLQVGGGLHLWPNALMALEQIELAEPMREAGSIEHHMLFLRPNGKLLANWPVGEIGDRLGHPVISVERGKIHRNLLEALDSSAVQPGCACVGFEQDDGGVAARFADGREEHGDVLLGGDGIRSVVRDGLFEEKAPRYKGYSARQALIDATFDEAPVGVMPAWWGRGRRFLFFHTGPERMCWVAIQNAAEGERDGPGEAKANLLDRYSGWPAPIGDMIEATPEESISRLDVYDRKPAKRWGQGRVSLLGDAAHPMTFDVGQGACMGIEDGIVVARHLSMGADDPAAALRAYEAERMPRTTSIAKLAATLGQAATLENRAAVALRERIMKVIFAGVGFKNFTKFMSHRV